MIHNTALNQSDNLPSCPPENASFRKSPYYPGLNPAKQCRIKVFGALGWIELWGPIPPPFLPIVPYPTGSGAFPPPKKLTLHMLVAWFLQYFGWIKHPESRHINIIVSFNHNFQQNWRKLSNLTRHQDNIREDVQPAVVNHLKRVIQIPSKNQTVFVHSRISTHSLAKFYS